MADRKLRVASPDEKPPTAKAVRTVLAAVTDGDQREQLVSMRVRIAKAIDDPNIRGADLAALSRRLLEIAKEIDALDAKAKEEADESDATPDDTWEAV